MMPRRRRLGSKSLKRVRSASTGSSTGDAGRVRPEAVPLPIDDHREGKRNVGQNLATDPRRLRADGEDGIDGAFGQRAADTIAAGLLGPPDVDDANVAGMRRDERFDGLAILRKVVAGYDEHA